MHKYQKLKFERKKKGRVEGRERVMREGGKDERVAEEERERGRKKGREAEREKWAWTLPVQEN